jgi:hypothetical protein
MHEREQPRAGLAALRHETVGITPCGEEPFLHRVFGELVIAQDAQGESIGDPPEAIVELRQRGLVGPRQQSDHGFVGEVGEGARHQPRSLAHRV